MGKVIVTDIFGRTPALEDLAIEHILPKKEPGFSIDDLAAILSCKKNVTVHRTPHLHGFMNQRSPDFSRSGYAAGLERLLTVPG